MFIYELYKSFIKNGDDEFFDYFEFVFWGLISLPIDILLSPLELLAFIIYKVRRNKQ